MHTKHSQLIAGLLILTITKITIAGTPLWTFTPLTATTLAVPANGTATVQYLVTNQSKRTHTLALKPITGITQLTGGGLCANPFTLSANASCTLSLSIDGEALTTSIVDGPVVCTAGSTLQCYRPSFANILQITRDTAMPSALIAVSGSPLSLNVNGSTGTLTILNNSTTEAANNITSDFTNTALDGNVTETGNTCVVVSPQSSCTLTFTPGNTVVPQTSFTISGTNTNTITAAIEITNNPTLSSINPSSGSASGGVGVTLTGTALTGTTSITFDGISATSINVINSTTVTAVTPAHAAGIVDVVITTPQNSAGLSNGFTYQTTATGQSAYGGIIGCLNGGLNNLIAAAADNSIGIEWGGFGITTNATSTTDGSTNTATIVSSLGNNGGTPYAAQLCNDYEIDSQGNTPCEPGNTCYNDWFLPAGNNTTASGQLNCLYTNRVSIGGFSASNYWSSTEQNSTSAYLQDFNNGASLSSNKGLSVRVRCVRAFTP